MTTKRLRVLFDAYELAPGSGKSIGIYNYAKNLLRELVALNDESVEFIVMCNTACVNDFTYSASNIKISIIGKYEPGKIARQFWMRCGAAFQVYKHGADIYFSPKGFLPNGLKLLSPRTKSVVVIHDLIPLWYREHHPGYFGWLEELIVNGSLIKSATTGDRVIAISQATASDIQRRLGRTVGIDVVHNGVPVSQPGKVPMSTPYIFAISSNLPHKNSEGLIAAYVKYREKAINPLPMVLCGVDQPPVDGIHAVKNLTDCELHGYYANARLFLFLSLIEGFGFPPLEAMSHGTKVLCSDIPSLREVTQNVANYVDPSAPDEICSKLLEILGRDAPPRDLIAKSISQYSWEACAKGVLNTLKTQSLGDGVMISLNQLTPLTRITARVLSVPIDAVSSNTAQSRVMAWGHARESRYVVFANVHVVVTASRESAFGAVVAGADMAAPDGAPVAWMLGKLSRKAQERVSGPDLTWALLGRCEQEALPVYFFGSTPQTLALLAKRVSASFPKLQVVGYESPPFRPLSAQEDAECITRINTSGAGLVFVGLGCPKQEQWMQAHRGKVNAVMLGVGAAFDFHAGTITRAPEWMGARGLEWLHRLASEPQRLWKRYLVTNTLFVLGAIRQLATRHAAR
jgi:N-acetylglucosaminyldiphosphoundecaprenol N-acetyl-beta-D-mannosaminyltransferase